MDSNFGFWLQLQLNSPVNVAKIVSTVKLLFTKKIISHESFRSPPRLVKLLESLVASKEEHVVSMNTLYQYVKDIEYYNRFLGNDEKRLSEYSKKLSKQVKHHDHRSLIVNLIGGTNLLALFNHVIVALRARQKIISHRIETFLCYRQHVDNSKTLGSFGKRELLPFLEFMLRFTELPLPAMSIANMGVPTTTIDARSFSPDMVDIHSAMSREAIDGIIGQGNPTKLVYTLEGTFAIQIKASDGNRVFVHRLARDVSMLLFFFLQYCTPTRAGLYNQTISDQRLVKNAKRYAKTRMGLSHDTRSSLGLCTDDKTYVVTSKHVWMSRNAFLQQNAVGALDPNHIIQDALMTGVQIGVENTHNKSIQSLRHLNRGNALMRTYMKTEQTTRSDYTILESLHPLPTVVHDVLYAEFTTHTRRTTHTHAPPVVYNPKTDYTQEEHVPDPTLSVYRSKLKVIAARTTRSQRKRVPSSRNAPQLKDKHASKNPTNKHGVISVPPVTGKPTPQIVAKTPINKHGANDEPRQPVSMPQQSDSLIPTQGTNTPPPLAAPASKPAPKAAAIVRATHTVKPKEAYHPIPLSMPQQSDSKPIPKAKPAAKPKTIPKQTKQPTTRVGRTTKTPARFR